MRSLGKSIHRIVDAIMVFVINRRIDIYLYSIRPPFDFKAKYTI